jgi:hypothetical protein
MPYWIAMGLIFFALIFEHILCRSNDLAKINIAFFQMNALVGLILVIGVGASLFYSNIMAADTINWNYDLLPSSWIAPSGNHK